MTRVVATASQDVRAVLLIDGWHLVEVGSFEPVPFYPDTLTGFDGIEGETQGFSFIEISSAQPVRVVVPRSSILALRMPAHSALARM